MMTASSLAPITLTAPTGDTITIPDGLFIGGKWQAPKGGLEQRIPVYNPATGGVLCEICVGTAADIDAAVEAAEKALQTEWGLKSTPARRGELMYKVRKDFLANWYCSEDRC